TGPSRWSSARTGSRTDQATPAASPRGPCTRSTPTRRACGSSPGGARRCRGRRRGSPGSLVARAGKRHEPLEWSEKRGGVSRHFETPPVPLLRATCLMEAAPSTVGFLSHVRHPTVHSGHLRNRSMSCRLTSCEIEPIVVHHLVPRRHEVTDELLL